VIHYGPHTLKQLGVVALEPVDGLVDVILQAHLRNLVRSGAPGRHEKVGARLVTNQKRVEDRLLLSVARCDALHEGVREPRQHIAGPDAVQAHVEDEPVQRQIITVERVAVNVDHRCTHDLPPPA